MFCMDIVIERMQQEMLRRKYSSRTVKTYAHCVRRFLRACRKDLKYITKQDVLDYLNKYTDGPGSTINVQLNAIKYLFQEILGKRLTTNIRYSKQAKRLPEFLSKEEVYILLASIPSQKHRLATALMYGAGLRVSELVHLRMKDLELAKGYGWVRQGKGNKDRAFIIPESIRDAIHAHDTSLHQQDWLFPNQRGMHLTTRSIQQIVKRAARRAGISKRCHPHMLRHSFATHLAQKKCDMEVLQRLLGHKNSNTTKVYIHLAAPELLQITSPLDDLPHDSAQLYLPGADRERPGAAPLAAGHPELE